MQRTTQNRNALMNFAVEARGKAYSKSTIELFRASRANNKKEGTDTFFCSQLVAKAYQQIGILAENLLANNFTPKDFGGEIPIKLIGAHLSDTLIPIHLKKKKK